MPHEIFNLLYRCVPFRGIWSAIIIVEAPFDPSQDESGVIDGKCGGVGIFKEQYLVLNIQRYPLYIATNGPPNQEEVWHCLVNYIMMWIRHDQNHQ